MSRNVVFQAPGDPILPRVDPNRVVSSGTVTLEENTTTTTVQNLAVGPQSLIFLYPMTANAQAIALPLANANKREFVLTHANDANTDKTFAYIVVAGDIRS